jgi:spore germination cell wall hydrolase CwlJ-like protein
LLTQGAQGPGIWVNAPAIAASEHTTAQLTRTGNDVTITGSVAVLFNTGSFYGPNRAEKTNRARLTPDGVTVSAGFDEVRTRLAELRAPKGKSGTSTMPPSLSTVSADNSSAVAAIDQVVPMAPTPMTATPQLAYARENTAPTGGLSSGDPTVDKYGNAVTAKDINCMAQAVYFEARGEPYRGQIAVGQVVMNRLHHPIYPKDICQVVFQNQQMHNACQFSFACDGIPETVTEAKPWAQAEEIARGVITGAMYLPEVGKATHYHATYVYPAWAPRLKRVAKIDHHIFYQFKRNA